MTEFAPEVSVVTTGGRFRVVGGVAVRVFDGILIVDGPNNAPLAAFNTTVFIYAKLPGAVVLREEDSAPGKK